MKFPNLCLLAAAVVLSGLSACSKKKPADDHAGHDHGSGHVHVAPHGGALLELGEHQYNLELVLDSGAGKLTAYVLDAHAENFVRITQRSIELSILSGGQLKALALNAVANAATGETIGNTSQFEATADWLKAASGVTGKVNKIELRGSSFSELPFKFSAPGGKK